jgi:hypothetical protein
LGGPREQEEVLLYVEAPRSPLLHEGGRALLMSMPGRSTPPALTLPCCTLLAEAATYCCDEAESRPPRAARFR